MKHQMLHLFLVLSLKTVKSLSTTIASQFKAPTADTPPSLSAAWKIADESLHSHIAKHVPAILDHTGNTDFADHLKGVQAILRHWGADDSVAAAGLFHSIYGTEGFQGFSLPLSERQTIRDVIGAHAEQLCFWFCAVDRSTVDQTVFDWAPGQGGENDIFTFRSRPEWGRFEMTLTKNEWLNFIELTLADWLEQVEGAATSPSSIFMWKKGEAYAYRRTAYARMSELLAVERAPRLSKIAPMMLQKVMETEGDATRDLVQLRTPPMSKAAEDALAALRAAGEKIPVDFAPQPLNNAFCSNDEGHGTSCR